MVDLSLADTLAAASAADPRTRIPDWRDKVAAFGLQAAEPLQEWLSQRSLGTFAIAVLEKIGHGSNRQDRLRSVELLQAALDVVPSQNRSLVSGALRRLGLSVSGPGLTVVGGGPIYHVLADHLMDNRADSDDLYLVECGWAYDGAFVRAHGGELDSGGRQVCLLCLEAIKRGFDDPVVKDSGFGTALSGRTWVLRNSWHELRGQATGQRVGDVFLTRCWRWIMVSGKDVVHGQLRAGEDADACLQCAKSLPVAPA